MSIHLGEPKHPFSFKYGGKGYYPIGDLTKCLLWGKTKASEAKITVPIYSPEYKELMAWFSYSAPPNEYGDKRNSYNKDALLGNLVFTMYLYEYCKIHETVTFTIRIKELYNGINGIRFWWGFHFR